jgi:hypothetical protein
MPMPKRIVVHVDAEMAVALRKERTATGVPTNEFVRRAIRRALPGLVLEPEQHIKNGGVSSVGDAVLDAALEKGI